MQLQRNSLGTPFLTAILTPGVMNNKREQVVMANGYRAVHRLALPSLLVLLSACGTTGVNEISPSTYSVSARYRSPNGSWARARQDAVAKANDFCAAKRQTYFFVNEQQSGVYGFSPQRSTITFNCGPNTTALVQSASLECKEQLQTSDLDPIRSKVELSAQTHGKALSRSLLQRMMHSLRRKSGVQSPNGPLSGRSA